MNSGCHLSLARRFVLAPAGVIADGVQFDGGLVVLRSRISPGIELYPGGFGEVPQAMVPSIEWIDALRPRHDDP